MKKTHKLTVEIPGKPQRSYDILIGENVSKDLGKVLKNYTNAQKFLIVTNETLYGLYKGFFEELNAEKVVLKDGEQYKNFESLQMIIESAIENRLERRDCFIAFGGGVIGDVTGFAAASYLRGVDFIQIPTTLLAQVDSSVGGKTAINHKQGKNLIGAFYQPKAVFSDISFLKTLDERQLKTGLGEVLKYAFIEKSCGCSLNYRFFDFLHVNKSKIMALEPEVLAEMISICCNLKSAVVQNDEREKGLRSILNFGHTFAHAIETLTDFTCYTHGEAVSMGMKMAFRLSVMLDLIDIDYAAAGYELIDKYALANEIPLFDAQNFIKAMTLDKKADLGKIRFVLPDGDFRVKMAADVDLSLIKEVLKKTAVF